MRTAALVALAGILLGTCDIVARERSGEAGAVPPTTVAIGRSGRGESFQADATVYRMRDRSAAGMQVLRRYRLSVRSVDGVVLGRVDTEAAYTPDGRARSVLFDGSQLVEFDTETLEVHARITMPASTRAATGALGQRAMPGLVDIPSIRSASARLGLKVVDEVSGKGLVIRLPVDGAFSTSALRLVHSDVLVDTERSRIIGSEAEYTGASGESVTVLHSFIYEERDGSLVTTGEVTEISRDYPSPIEPAATSPADDPPIVGSADEIPCLSEAEMEALEQEGYTFAESDPVIGDPHSLDSTETLVTTYDGIGVNTLDDSLFRLPFLE